MNEAGDADSCTEGDSPNHFSSGNSKTGPPTKNGVKKILCIKGSSSPYGAQQGSPLPAQHPMDTMCTDTYKPMTNSGKLMIKYTPGTSTFRGDASDTGHQFRSGVTAGSDSVEANSGSDETDSNTSDDNAPSDSEQLQEPDEESGTPKHDEVPPTPQPTDQHDKLLAEELLVEADPTPPAPGPQLMDQAMALDNARSYSTSSCVNVADVDSACKDKTEISKPVKTSRTDHSLAGKSKANRVVSQLKKQQTTATGVKGGPNQRKRFVGSDSSPSPNANADESVNDSECGWPGDDVGEPPPPIHRRCPSVDDTQDVVVIENECVEVSRKGEPLQLLAVHMEPHDYDLLPLPLPLDGADQPFPAQESEEGRSKPSQLAPP